MTSRETQELASFQMYMQKCKWIELISITTEYYTEGSLDEKSVTRIGSCQGGECFEVLAKNSCIEASSKCMEAFTPLTTSKGSELRRHFEFFRGVTTTL